MEWTKFLLFNIIGAFLWVGLWGGAAYFLGGQLPSLAVLLKGGERYLLEGIAVLLLSFFFWRQFLKK
jgi:membrane protein DedA with SNARE-associated domain